MSNKNNQCPGTWEGSSPGARSEFFFVGGGWQAVSLGGGVTVMEKREILAGWVTKVCLKSTNKAGVGREGDI